MASIELPQESGRASHSSIALYSTSLSLRFVSDQNCAADSGRRLTVSARGFAQKPPKHGSFGLGCGCAGSAEHRSAWRVHRRRGKDVQE
jgi:hypothetical protein